MVDNASMLSLCDPVHLVLIKTEVSGETVLVSSNFLEWRPVLAAQNCRCNLSTEMMGIGELGRDCQRWSLFVGFCSLGVVAVVGCTVFQLLNYMRCQKRYHNDVFFQCRIISKSSRIQICSILLFLWLSLKN